MTAPTQRPASTSDARKRLAERGASATLVAELIGCKGCRNAGITAPAEPDADEREATEEPIDVGWYAYSGGRQSMIFHLRDTGQWSAHFADGTASDCAWGYIEQALGVWDLVPLAPARTPDAHLAAAKAEALREAGAKVAAMRNGATGRRVTNAEYLGQVVYAMGDDIEYQAARAARLREQGGDQ